MRVQALIPGAVIQLMESKKATCIGVIEQHPVWPQLCLVIWILDDGSVSLDALHPKQDVGKEVGILNRDSLKELMVGRHDGRRLHFWDDSGEESSGQEEDESRREDILPGSGESAKEEKASTE
ncbi:MAG: hypothetical protein ACRDSF_00035 [Pseudonocardiaceae bacterium]